jgi:hypothetical protein
MTLRLTRLEALVPFVTASRTPTDQFQRLYQKNLEAIELAVNNIQDTLDAIQAAQDAADAANDAAAAAQDAADTANTAATTISMVVTVVNAYPTGLAISATDAGASATISVSAHNEVYPQSDGSNVTVSVNSGTVTSLSYSTDYWIYYDDPTQAGGAVTYHATTTQSTAAQIGGRIAVGAVRTPAPAGALVNGNYRLPPGTVEP